MTYTAIRTGSINETLPPTALPKVAGPHWIGTEGRKSNGAYYTPGVAVATLVGWALRSPNDRLLDPSCGDGRFLAHHVLSVGVEHNPKALAVARQRAPMATIHEADFFAWAGQTKERFDCAVGNPPFIRYQRFNGEVRKRALELCASLGADFSGLSSSWAPYLVATASMLKPGGRMSFVVPAEIGHAPYASPLLQYLADHFTKVQLVAMRAKLFPELSEDVWFLFADGHGGKTDHFTLTPMESPRFLPDLPKQGTRVSLVEWRQWNCRLRPMLMPRKARDAYRQLADRTDAFRLGDLARVGIGYVTGGNDFFHLRPSQADSLGIGREYLHPTVRNGRVLKGKAITHSSVKAWLERDEPVLLLNLRPGQTLSAPVRHYLDSQAGKLARQAYKCRSRSPWYAVPDVHEPTAFLSYMSGAGPSLVANHARCVCTNSVHAVRLTGNTSIRTLQRAWSDPLTKLSCEVEGHPLGGGMLKVEPREAAKIVLVPDRVEVPDMDEALWEGVRSMKLWRHSG